MHASVTQADEVSSGEVKKRPRAQLWVPDYAKAEFDRQKELIEEAVKRQYEEATGKELGRDSWSETEAVEAILLWWSRQPLSVAWDILGELKNLRNSIGVIAQVLGDVPESERKHRSRDPGGG